MLAVRELMLHTKLENTLQYALGYQKSEMFVPMPIKGASDQDLCFNIGFWKEVTSNLKSEEWTVIVQARGDER
jgi:hypothetical protein